MRQRRPALLTCVAALAVTASLLVPTAAQAAPVPAVVVTEIVADNVGDDHFEYVEVHNTSTEDVVIGDDGLVLAYSYADSDDTARDVPLQTEQPVPLAAGETAVLWLSYTSGAVDSFARTVADFRAHHLLDEATPVVRLTGQPGMANGGNRGIRVLDGDEILSWSFYPGGSVGPDLAAQFRVAEGPGTDLLEGAAAPNPGVVDPEQLVPAEPEPEPEPDPQPDPDLVTTPLQITEVLPDSTNVGTADGYEFIELYNATDTPFDLADHQLVYLYPQSTEVNTNEAPWPLVPDDAVVQPGDTLVVWVKNGQNDDLDADDFNARFGSDLELGVDLVETFTAGMANGSARGMAIRTNTGFDVTRAYYNMDGADDVEADQGIRYAVDPDDPQLQRLLDAAPATPGRVQADQIPAGLMVVPPDTTPPTLQDRTPSAIDPAADFTVELHATDDIGVRTVTLELRNDVDTDPRTINLQHDRELADDTYRHTVVAADLIGKSWYEYTLTITDGTHTITTDPVRVPVEGADDTPLRLGVDDGDLLAGTVTLSAAGEVHPPAITLAVDGEDVPVVPALESEPVFVFEESQTDFYFRNGVRIGEEVLYVFDQGSYSATVTHDTGVPLSMIDADDDLVVSIWAGTKAGPWIDLDENNDDFVVSGMRLVLPDGRTLTPAGYDGGILQMGDSAGKLDYHESVFTIPADAYVAASHEWDTTAVADGEHVVSATDGAEQVQATVVVDNTPPVVVPSIADGETYQGEIVLDAEVTDATSGVEEVTATLDGEPVELGTTTSSVALTAGEHELEITAVDAAGNQAVETVTFTVPEEMPEADWFAPADGTVVDPGDVTLQARVSDPTADELEVAFYEGYRLTEDDPEVTAQAGTVADALATERTGSAGTPALSSVEALPYYEFEVEVPDGADDDARVRIGWTGTANAGAEVLLHARTVDGDWVEVDRGTAEGGDIALSGTVLAGEHARDGVITVLVQHSSGYAGPALSDRGSAVDQAHPDDVPRTDYDFTIAWESDTQYYNEEFTEHQVAIHDYLLDRREALNLQYVIHTGDIVDDYDQPYQWENASPQYARFDDAGLPYGVLAGNHDVGSQLSDYSVYSSWFGEDRYAGNPWYGESFQDNRGHYDLISAGGIDFLMLSMGWDPGDDAIDWMNEVLARYPDRVAVVNLHEFMLTTGGLGPIPQRIMDEVVATNPNVRMVLSGHYHDAFTRIDTFDDDGDGTPDRTVHSMLFDYQGLPEGGLGYLRLLHFDNEGERMMVRTYSPSLEDYNSDDPGLLGPAGEEYVYQEFDVAYADLGIEPVVRTLSSTSLEVEILTDVLIGDADATAAASGFAAAAAPGTLVSSGEVATTTWTLTDPGEHGWYVRSADPHGAVDDSAVQRLVVRGEDAGGGGGEGSTGGGDAGGGSAGGADGDAPPSDRPGLPSTGASVAGLLLLAGAALGTGAVLRVVGRRRSVRS